MDESQLTNESKPTPADPAKRVYIAIVALTALGLGASTALLVDYLRPLPLFCSETGGCAELRHSIYSHMMGLPTPAVGVAGYSLLALLTLLRGDTARFFHLVAATFGALAAGYFLFLQFSLWTFCAYCMTVDLSTIVLLSLVLMRVRTEADGTSIRGTLAVAGIFALAAAMPLLSNVLIKTPVPDVIAAEMKKTPPGQITVVDFVDFECPYCRQTATDFAPTLEKYRGKYRLVRKQMPLTNMHPHAATAARAACCADTMGKGDIMADRLFSAPIDDLTDDGCAAIAQSVGLDETAFRACVADPKTQKTIDADHADFKSTHGHALPTIWINGEVIEGAQGPDALRKAMEHAAGEVGG
jgi:uncharacterized membrane protein/protein-disulfide isomerase